ncbi:Thylakoid membrane protein TERC, chloroplastic [Gracilariopsis chorda]|uniref:Thylakoid membrane protein TERC, chloroplastic n=1 Tax=Gracilariopsis chorda TaxID=448386 RepID=A0A2V3IQ79_9FLOR|nr:Thylakoid membrane protein TERC, chloroplastic [Gracilariopsis chorda]|eukprot:PXF43290.1 Thylakoid membrane protein TERC, chloroplastic [Gracilariopsis chorda]
MATFTFVLPTVAARSAPRAAAATCARIRPVACAESPRPAPPASSPSAPPQGADAQHHSHHRHHFAGEPRRVADDIRVTLSCVALALAVAAGFYHHEAASGIEFLTAYIIEYALSVDNLLVFLLIFDYFAVPRAFQSRVLSFGLTGAVIMRGVFIIFGEALTHRFKPASLIFAAILLFSAAKLALSDEEDEEDLSNNAIVKFANSVLPVSDAYSGDRFFVRNNGIKVATPLLLVLLVVEISDLVFALDSVPAVLGVSDRTSVIYVSNVLAVLGLRSLYFLLADSIANLRFLQPALAFVLAFIGAKMGASVFQFEVPVTLSLSVVVSTLGSAVLASLLFPPEDDDDDD